MSITVEQADENLWEVVNAEGVVIASFDNDEDAQDYATECEQ